MSLHEVAQDLLQTDHHLHDNVEALGSKLTTLEQIISQAKEAGEKKKYCHRALFVVFYS
jgi:hypothetical protein